MDVVCEWMYKYVNRGGDVIHRKDDPIHVNVTPSCRFAMF